MMKTTALIWINCSIVFIGWLFLDNILFYITFFRYTHKQTTYKVNIIFRFDLTTAIHDEIRNYINRIMIIIICYEIKFVLYIY